MFFPGRQLTSTVVKATTTLTSSYVAGTPVSSDEGNALCVQVIYTKGDETSIQVKIEATNDTGSLDATSSAWYQQVTQTASGGTVTLAPAEYSMTAASAATVQNWTIVVSPVKASGFKISTKSTGGSVVGTYSIKAFMAWV